MGKKRVKYTHLQRKLAWQRISMLLVTVIYNKNIENKSFEQRCKYMQCHKEGFGFIDNYSRLE